MFNWIGKYCNYRLAKINEFYLIGIAYASVAFLEDYQDKCRVFLDEYPEQEKLRGEYFKEKENKFLTKHFLERK